MALEDTRAELESLAAPKEPRGARLPPLLCAPLSSRIWLWAVCVGGGGVQPGMAIDCAAGRLALFCRVGISLSHAYQQLQSL